MRKEIFCATMLAWSAFAHAELEPTFDDVVVGEVSTTAGGPLTLHMDIYKANNVDTPTPVVLWIHGGGWTQGSYNDRIPEMLQPLLDQGVSVASVQYRFSSHAPFPAQIHDVKGAVRFLRAHADEYDINPLRIAVAGASAGGHLAALLSTSGGVQTLEGASGGNLDQSSRVMAVVDYFGPTDFFTFRSDVTDPPGLLIDSTSEKSMLSMLLGFDKPGQGIGLLTQHADDPKWEFASFVELARMANPITHITPDDPPTFIAHGTADNIVPLKQSQRLRDALMAKGVASQYMEAQDAGHGALGVSVDESAMRFLLDALKLKAGDATRDGVVNETDLMIVAQNYDQPNRGWNQGDFNSDGKVDFADLLLVSQNYEGEPGHTFENDWKKARGQ
ncbi:MAG TPA: alpha/beta fold hydrolase [Tepidisphaeraceae bacterium]|nr:alpha/beta fold hydrolase [Tepidisphaeraceae bacterium]